MTQYSDITQILQYALNNSASYGDLLDLFAQEGKRFTDNDDRIYGEFRVRFPKFNVHSIDTANLDDFSEQSRWKEFVFGYAHLFQRPYRLRMLRIDSSKGYTKDNTIPVSEIVFLIIEMARYRENCNRIPHPESINKS